MASVMLGYATT